MALTARDLSPGDRVVFREYGDMLEEFGDEGRVAFSAWFNCGMQYLCGTRATIKSVDESTNQVWIVEDEWYNYNAAMFEIVRSPSNDAFDVGEFLDILTS